MTPSKSTDPSTSQAVAWVLRLRAATCSAQDRQQFVEWLSQHPEHSRLYAHYDAQWQQLERFKNADFPVRDAALAYRPKLRRHKIGIGIGLAMAASLLLAVTGFNPDGWYGSQMRYTVALGQHQTIVLADGSQMDLNSNTDVKVHFSRWRRSVELLHGEAFFQVAHQSQREFSVTAANGRIVDIGTAFDVYLKTDKVLVAVQKGKVRVDAKNSLELKENQWLAYNSHGDFVSIATESVENLTAWRQGQLVFNSLPLDDVLAELSRYHHQQVRLDSSVLGKLKVSGRFRIGQFDSALNTIAATLPVIIQRPDADTVILKSR